MASDLGLHGLPMSNKKNAMPSWVKAKPSLHILCTFSGSSVSIDLEDGYGSADQREAYEKMLADTIEIRFENNQSTNFIVSEIGIHARWENNMFLVL